MLVRETSDRRVRKIAQACRSGNQVLKIINMTEIRIFLLLPSSVVEQLLEASADFRTFIERRLAHSDHVRRFPDGALEVEGEEAYVEMRDLLRADGTLEFGLEGRSGFRSLAPLFRSISMGFNISATTKRSSRARRVFITAWGTQFPRRRGNPSSPNWRSMFSFEIDFLTGYAMPSPRSWRSGLIRFRSRSFRRWPATARLARHLVFWHARSFSNRRKPIRTGYDQLALAGSIRIRREVPHNHPNWIRIRSQGYP